MVPDSLKNYFSDRSDLEIKSGTFWGDKIRGCLTRNMAVVIRGGNPPRTIDDNFANFSDYLNEFFPHDSRFEVQGIDIVPLSCFLSS